MLGELPKLADKAFILGFFLPTFLFALALAGLFHDQPWGKTLLDAAGQTGGWDALLYFVLAVWGCAVLLMMVNHTELQILEGYRWPVSKISMFRRSEERRFARKQARADELARQWDEQGDAFPKEQLKELAGLQRELVQQFPLDESNRLPTRFGNAIRAFEVYSSKIYGADSIPLWLHLSTTIPTDFQGALDDARAQVNCAVNICFFAAVTCLLAIARFVWGFDWHVLGSPADLGAVKAALFNDTIGIDLLIAIVAAIVCRLAYLFSIKLVYPWGDLVKAAFDCYLPDLAKKMGFELPETADKRYEFWQAVSRQAIYWERLEPAKWKPPANDKPADNPSGPMDEFARLVSLVMRDR